MSNIKQFESEIKLNNKINPKNMYEISNCENKPFIFEDGKKVMELENKGIKAISISNGIVVTDFNDGCGLLHEDFIGFKPNTIWKGVEINSLDEMFKIGINNTKPVTIYDFIIKELNKMQLEALNINLCELNGTDGIYKLIAFENKLN